MNRVILPVLTLVIVGGFLIGASQPRQSASIELAQIQEQLETIEEKLETLQEKVEHLSALKPTFPVLMPELSERFHVLHFAGEAQDWAVAQHELQEMKRLIELGTVIDKEKGPILDAYTRAQLETLGEAIEHQDGKAFMEGITQLSQICNACHAAVGSPWLKVALDPPDTLSLRHPHQLGKTAPPPDHMHHR